MVPSALHANQQPDEDQHKRTLDNLIQVHPAGLDRDLEVVAMARAAIHLKVVATIFHAIEIKPDLTGRIGSAELLTRCPIRLQKTNDSPGRRLSVGKPAAQFKITVEIVECAFDGPEAVVLQRP